MAGEEAKKAEGRSAAPEAPRRDKKAVTPLPRPPPASRSEEEDKKPPAADDSMALVVFEITASTILSGTKDQIYAKLLKYLVLRRTRIGAQLTEVETEKRVSLIKAWEENEKAKAENKAAKKLSAILSWENTKKAIIGAQVKNKEEELEKKKAEYAEKMNNKVAIAHRQAEEKRAMVVARRGEEILKAEEMAAKYHATGLSPKKLLGCFGA